MSTRVKIAIASLALLATMAPAAFAYTGVPAGFTFTKNIPLGTVSQDVVYLKAVLIGEGCGVGISNTQLYASHTKANVKCFQQKYFSQISAFAGYPITYSGLVGAGTRAQLNALLSGVVPPVNPPVGQSGSLNVMLAADSPMNGTIANATTANFTKFTLTAATGTVNISRLYVTRTGLSTNNAITNIKVIDAATGAYVGSIGSLNTNNQALITFTQNLIITAGSPRTFIIRATVGNTTNAPAGNTVALGINAADITSTATSVTGSATGSLMSVVSISTGLGSLTIEEDGTTVDSQPNVGTTGVVLNNFRLAAGSGENVTVDAVTMIKAGNIQNSYLANLTLYDVTKGAVVATVPSLNAEGKATWGNLNIVIGKGNTERFQIRGDIVDGPGQTANADLVDGSDVLVSAKGNTYGFYIAPTAVGSWGGQGTANQTVQNGGLTVALSAATPATGNTSSGSDKLITVFDLNAVGEAMKVSSLRLQATLGTLTYDQITAIKVYDENGNIVTGPSDLLTCSGATAANCPTAQTTAYGYVTFTDTFIVPVGIHKYSVKAKLANDVSALDTIAIGIANPRNDVSATGMTSNSSINVNPSGSAVTGKTLTVKAVALTVTTLSDPAARNVGKGSQNYVWATASLSAANSGEDVQVTTITINDSNASGANADLDDLSNVALYADLTPANSDRGDVFETRISNFVNPSGHTPGAVQTQAFTLTQTLTIPAGSFVKVALVGSLSASANTTTDVHIISFYDGTGTSPYGIVANGASTGTAVNGTAMTSSVTSAQGMTVSGSGTLTITKDASTPVSDLVIGNSTVTLGVFRLAETSNVENLDLQDITLSVTNGTAVNSYWFYNGSTLLGSVAGGTSPKLVVPNGTLTVPANSYVRLTVKGQLLPVDGSVVTNGLGVTATIQGTAQVNMTGLSTGAAITSGVQSAIANTMTIVKAKPVVTLAAASPTGTLFPGTAEQLAIFSVTNQGADDITFSSAESNLFIVNISRSQTASDGVAGNWQLKDEAGNLLSQVSVADTDSSVKFIFDSNSFSVAPGETKKLYVYGDTHEYTSSSNHDSIQLYLSDSITNDNTGSHGADNNCSYSVNFLTTIPAGTTIFRGNIYAGALSHS